MDILTNKTKESKDYISRYSNFYYYYNTKDQKYMYGLTSQLSTDTTYALIDVHEYDTLDYFANKYYGRPDYYWVIADFNRIQDPFIKLSDYFTQIKIPNIGSIEFED